MPELSLMSCRPKSIAPSRHAGGPTINLNSLYSRVAGDVLRQRTLQGMLESVMQQLMAMAAAKGCRVFLPACH